MSFRDRFVSASGWAFLLGLILFFASALDLRVLAFGVVLPAAVWLFWPHAPVDKRG